MGIGSANHSATTWGRASRRSAPCDSAGLSAVGHRCGRRGAVRPHQRTRCGRCGLDAYGACEGCGCTSTLSSTPSGKPSCASPDALRACSAGDGGGLRVRGDDLCMARNRTADGRVDRGTRLPGGDGLYDDVRSDGHHRESVGGGAAALGRPPDSGVMAGRSSTGGERVALGTLLLLAAAVVIVPMLASHDPLRIDDVLARRLVRPFATDDRGAWHLLGTDRFGRDLFVRMMLAGGGVLPLWGLGS